MAMPDPQRTPGPGTGALGQAGAGSALGAAEGEWASVQAGLLKLAADVIDMHTNDGGRCARCTEPWPCLPAGRAEFLLGAL